MLSLLRALSDGVGDGVLTLATTATAAKAVELLAPLPMLPADHHACLLVLRR